MFICGNYGDSVNYMRYFNGYGRIFIVKRGVMVRDKGVGGHGINPRCRPCDHRAGNHGQGLRPEFSLSDIY